jgi:hypothetical protein
LRATATKIISKTTLRRTIAPLLIRKYSKIQKTASEITKATFITHSYFTNPFDLDELFSGAALPVFFVSRVYGGKLSGLVSVSESVIELVPVSNLDGWLASET